MRVDRRTVIAGAGAGIAAGAFAAGESLVDLHLPGGPSERPLSPRFPQKGEMIVQRVRPPLLETPFAVFDKGTITPNDQHFVRWHWDVPTVVDVSSYRLAIRGAVKAAQSLSLAEVLRAGEHVEFVAVNQCAGNSRGFSDPRVPGAQWAHGAMSNARWKGVRLKDLLDKAGIGGDAKHIRFKGLDTPAMPGAPAFIKSIPIDVARRDDTIVAFAMNGEALPVLNGFPIRLVVPGWFSTYWVKMLSDIEVLTGDDDSFFMAKSYRMPTVPVKPGDKDFPTVPITTMGPRSFVTSHLPETQFTPGQALQLRGIAFGGDCGIERVTVRANGATHPASLEPEDGPYGFRRWAVSFDAPAASALLIETRCTNTKGVAQPDVQPWNPSGYARTVVELLTLRAA